MAALRSRTVGLMTCWWLKARSCAVSVAARSAASRIASTL